MKKLLAIVLLLALMVEAIPAALADTPYGTSIMYVKTENGKPVNVRSSPKKGNNIIGSAPYGHDVLVDWSYAGNDGWTRVVWGSKGDGYIMSRYLVSSKPKDTEKRLQELKDQEELKKQEKSYKKVSSSFNVVVRASRTSGWVNFRKGPGVAADRIATLPDGRVLTVIGQTSKWYKAKDTVTGKTGYVSKSYVVKQAAAPKATAGPTAAPTAAPTPEPILSTKEQMGKLTVNGEFALQCQLPEGYTMQLINAMGTKITAFITSENKEKPILQLSVAFDDLYANVKRMNDMSEDDLKVLEETFTEMNEVDISYKETAYGTKLLIAKEVGAEKGFVDILSVYEGYFIEFVMSPNPEAQDQKLTDTQIQMCIDFLTDLDFVPVQ